MIGQISATATMNRGSTLPVLRLGFRPFYLLGAAFAVVNIGLWLAQYFGFLALSGYLSGALWHSHEMVFGAAGAIIVGFLFTAGRNWTGLPTPTGGRLAALAVLWLAGRVLAVTGPGPLAAVVDVGFFAAVAAIMARLLWRGGQRQRLPVVAVLVLLACANAAFHLSAQGVVAISPRTPLHCALFAIVLMVTLIGGWVIPNFTANALQGIRLFRSVALDRAAIAATAIAFLANLLAGQTIAAAALSGLAALLQAARCLGWKPWASTGRPILWVLHLSYAWIPVGLLLLALASLGWVPESAALHALAVGAIAGMILGMITRTALGHTGRPLQAGPAETAAYTLIHLAALLRVLAPILAPQLYLAALLVSGALFASAFVTYLAVYLPYLTQARADGREG